jgi:TRAP-type C4-dicarboxylate transport system substrate-binding protein
MRSVALVVVALAAALPARADPTVLRFAVVAPDGTNWSRELKAFARDLESSTHGALRIKWYFGGIAGDDVQAGERVRRDQLDGVGSAGMLCGRLAPSMRVLSIPGLVQSREESAYVLTRLKQTLDEEFARSGFVNLAEAGLGPQVIVSRRPIQSMADLRRGRFWVWDLDEVMVAQAAELGVPILPLPLDGAARAYDESRIDGFFAIPTAALAFQWSAQARYYTDLRMSFLAGCLLVANRAFDPLPIEHQRALRAASAKLQVRLEDLGRTQDDALLGGLFARQGLKPVALSDSFRSEFLEAARTARDRLGDKLIARPLVGRVMEVLADYRAEHRAPVGDRR